MALDFPTPSNTGEIHTENGYRFVWDGSKWQSQQGSSAFNQQIVTGNTKAEVVDTGSDGHFKVTTEGGERLRIDSSGRLLVGTSSTSIGTTAVFQGSSVSDNTNADVKLACDSTAPGDGGNLAILKFTDGTHVDGARIFAQRDGGTWSSSSKPTRLIFSTASNSSASPTERMRIDSSGNVIVGTTSNTRGRLNVFNGDDFNTGTLNDGDNIYLISDATSGNNVYGASIAFSRTQYQDRKAAAIAAVQTSSDAFHVGLAFFTHSSSNASDPIVEAARITGSGNLGIASTSPTAKIEIGGIPNANSVNECFTIDRSDGTQLYSINYNQTTNTVEFQGNNKFFAFQNKASQGESMRIDNSGSLLIGTTSNYADGGADDIVIGSTGVSEQGITIGASTSSQIRFADAGRNTAGYILYNHSADALVFSANGTERMRVDSSGRLLVNKSGSPSAGEGAEAPVFIQGNTTNASGPAVLGLARGQSAAEMSNGASLGIITFTDDAGNDFGEIKGACDGSAGSSDHPGRLTFLTTPNGSSSPQERMRITEQGFTKFTNTGNYVNATGGYHEFNSGNASTQTLIVKSISTVFAYRTLDLNVVRSANSAYSFLRCFSGNYSDTEFNLRGDGNAYADGSWNGGGADYAEYFEWSDGNTEAEDRRGISVVLDGDKIREAVTGEEPIGVISGNPSVVGDADIEQWKGKYLRDDYGTYIEEDYEVEDEDGNTVVQQRRQLNPDYNSDTEYVTREKRAEWDTVGLMGKLRIRKGQITGARWIKMRDVSDTVEEWLVR
jgi:hypothetical protein